MFDGAAALMLVAVCSAIPSISYQVLGLSYGYLLWVSPMGISYGYLLSGAGPRSGSHSSI